MNHTVAGPSHTRARLGGRLSCNQYYGHYSSLIVLINVVCLLKYILLFLGQCDFEMKCQSCAFENSEKRSGMRCLAACVHGARCMVYGVVDAAEGWCTAYASYGLGIWLSWYDDGKTALASGKKSGRRTSIAFRYGCGYDIRC